MSQSILQIKPRALMNMGMADAMPHQDEGRDATSEGEGGVRVPPGNYDAPMTPKQQGESAHEGEDAMALSPRSIAASGSACSATACGDSDECDGDSVAPTALTSLEEAIALEVGMSAQEYLEECFYVTEVNVLDKAKFDAVPEIIKGDFSILGHLGTGSFSDVFEVVAKGGGGGRPASSPPEGGAGTAPKSAAFALKCLRPEIRLDAEQFTIGAEDIVHETAILASLRHPHVIRLYGRAAGHLEEAFVLNDGYFILLERLDDALPDRISRWREDPNCAGSTPEKLRVVRDVADAMDYLHSRRIIFRDLKPANVGFDPRGVVKLFDFGFAAGLPDPTRQNPNGYVYERCGTPRFMAPEVGLERGYGLKADVYSVGMLLWEVCAMEMPFGDISDPDEFEERVFVGGERPAIGKGWPGLVRKVIERCWTTNPGKRPKMAKVREALSAAVDGGGSGRSLSMKAPAVRLKSGLSRLRSA